MPAATGTCSSCGLRFEHDDLSWVQDQLAAHKCPKRSMTDDQIDALTLGELRRIAARGLEVLADLQRLSAMMPGASPIQMPAPVAVDLPPPRIRQQPGVLGTNKGPARLSPAEMAERQRLIQKNVDEGVPPDVAAAEAQSMPMQEE